MNLTSDNWISILAIIISTIVAFLTAYFTVKYSLKNEKNKGQIILVELIKRYFSSCWNSWDMETGRLHTDNLTKQQYLRVVERIEQDLLELQNNMYYSSILEKYPSVTIVQIQLSRDIAELQNIDSFFLNTGTTNQFYKLYSLIKKNLPRRYRNNEKYKDINDSIERYVRSLRKNKAQQCLHAK